MGTIFKRTNSKGQTTYTARVRKKGYPERVATFDRRVDASDWVKQEETKIRQGLYLDEIEAKKHTLNEVLDRFIEEEKPIPTKLLHLKRWKEFLGSRYLSAVNDITINGVISELKNKKGLKPATLNRHLDSLSVAMKQAKKWGWIKRNPVSDVERHKEPKGRVRFLSDDERKKLLKAAKQSKYPQLYFIIVLALSTGMRKEELLSLRWKDVDVKEGIIILQKTKNKEKRRVPVRGHALELLQQHGKIRRIDSDFLFPGENESPQKECNKIEKCNRHFDIRKSWQKALADSKIEDFVFHDLRHSCASYLAMNGATLLEIAEVLGHRTLDVVKRYAHLSESHTSMVIESMNKKIFNL